MFQKIGDPVANRCAESASRPSAFEELGRSLMMVRKALELYTQGDEKYNHIEKADMEKVKIMLIICIRTQNMQHLALKLHCSVLKQTSKYTCRELDC